MKWSWRCVTVCREHTHSRGRREEELACGIQDNARTGLVLYVVATHVHGLHSIEVQVLHQQRYIIGMNH